MSETETPAAPASKSSAFDERDVAFVTECWTDIRTCKGLDLYFGKKLSANSRWNRGFEFGIATFATGSGAATGTAVIAAWAFWQTGPGRSFWAVLTVGAALAAVIKPFIGFDGRISRYSRLQQEYRALDGLLRDLPFMIRQENRVSQNHRAQYAKIRARMMDITKDWPATFDEELLDSCQKKVIENNPTDKLWVPAIESTHTAISSSGSGSA